MGQVTGRGSAVTTKSITLSVTAGSTAATATAGSPNSGDVGAELVAQGSPPALAYGVKIAAVAGNAVTLSTAALVTRTGVVAAVQPVQDAQAAGFRGWSPESTAEAATHGGSGNAPVHEASPKDAARGRRSR